MVLTANMGLFTTLAAPIEGLVERLPTWQLFLFALTASIPLVILQNVFKQLLFKNPKEPPVVFHLLPFIGSTVAYGIDPFKFFFACREKVVDFSDHQWEPCADS